MQKCKVFFYRFAKKIKMNIILYFDISPEYVNGNNDVSVVIKNAPYVPQDGVNLEIGWHDFLDEKTADIALAGILQHRLVPIKTSEIWSKEKIEVYFEFEPLEMDDEDLSDAVLN